MNNEAGAASTQHQHQVAGPELTNTQPTKKRKPNANGPRQTAACWEHFIRLPDSEVDVQTAACKHCHQRYLCDPKTHGTSNLNTHMNKCHILQSLLKNGPNQTILTFPAVEGSSLVPVSSRFNQLACRKALAVYIILDEQPFRTVESHRNLQDLSKGRDGRGINLFPKLVETVVHLL